MNPDFAKKLGLWVCKTKVNVPKIDDSKLDTFDIVIASFSITYKKRRSCFFVETFLLADISIDIALGISFLTLSNVEINFLDCHIH